MNVSVLLVLTDLKDEYWHGAFVDERRCGVSIDGHYHRDTDLDWILMWCGVAV